MIMANRAFSLATGNNFVFASTTNLLSIAGNATGAPTLKLYNGKVVGDISAANLVHQFTFGAGAITYGFAGLTFPAGIVAVLTLNGGTADVLLEHD